MRVTVVTICYNAAATVARAAASVLAQEGVDLDYVVIDGGSTDGTLQALGMVRDRIAHFVSEPDRGIYDALNKGLAAARGDVIGFLHADDAFAAPTSLRDLLEARAAAGAEAVYADIVFVTADDRPVRLYRGATFAPARLREGIMPPHPSFYCATAILREIGGFATRYRSAGDFDLMVRLFLKRGLSAAYLPRTVVRMRIGGTSTQGWASYARTSREIITALEANAISPDRLAIWGRALRKVPEWLEGLGARQAAAQP